MADPPSYDQHLLDRLNALKKSTISLDASKPSIPTPPKQTAPEDALSARLRSLRNGSLSPSPSPAPPSKAPAHAESSTALPTEDQDPLHQNIDEQTLDELLADLGPDDQWTLNPDDPKHIQKLLNEAKSALPRDELPAADEPRNEEGNGDGKTSEKFLTRDLDMSVFALDDGEETKSGDGRGKEAGLEDESREARDIVARLLDEVRLEKENEGEGEEEEEEDSVTKERGGFSLPSAPSTLPSPPPPATEPSRKSLDFETDIVARMAALKGLGSTNELGLPSAPTFKPTDKSAKEISKKFSDEEIDSWCIICQDDATVQCDGCDGDLYCANCWKEGHMGPDVGREERGHRWSRYKKPK
ncbi:Abscission/NoCut checkpoint regulator [Lachnellula hyalina]|uniref:Abscission/NoCut checkpoint regulator n=1 Tax=Lachnellula hyalina TaxID=1316788 RepID=A0A8H8QWH9_9HELO|nr:Abscission/NoCut checkpoint regulator [Lachnellula hyalina]TVY24044.1 Abscission/NoCut checkpoint regulator [Lachnellula hyalina]